MEPLRWRLRSQHGFQAQTFSYPSISRPSDDNIDRLANFLAGLGAPVIHLVGHSLGGVLALRALRRLQPAFTSRVVCLGSPLLGSAAAQALEGWPGGNILVGSTLHETVLTEPLSEWRGPQQVGVLAGRLGFGAGLVLNTLRGEHDGAVTVAETRLPGITDHRVLPVTHTGMLLSRRVADETAHFLRNGSFQTE